MGHDKAAVEVAGRPMFEWVRRSLEEVCDGVLVAGRVDVDESLPTVSDPPGDRAGPLAGLVAAMRSRPGVPVFLAAVDQPWLKTSTVARLGESLGDLTVAPVDAGVRQTTCAAYPPSVLGAAEEELAGGGSLQSLLDVVAFTAVVDWRSWGEDGRSWYSVDTPKKLEEGLARFGPPV